MARQNPLGPGRTGGGLGSGCLAVVVSPIITGVCLGYLLMSLGPEFPGEPVAREVTAQRQRIDRHIAEGRRRRGG